MARTKSGKRLGGKASGRRSSRFLGDGQRTGQSAERIGLVAVLVGGLFVVGMVAGFGWSLDRQVRGGLLAQQVEAEQRPDWVRLDDLPAYVPAVFVAVVDPAFIEQGAIRAGDEGTTLARELARQVHLLPSTFTGEARELMMGPVLERRLTKARLLEIFLNRIHLGTEQGYPVYGIGHGAREYFDKAPAALTLGEAATLAGLLLQPRITDPDSRPGAVGARRNEVLRVLLLSRTITPAEYAAAVAEPLGFQPGLERMPMTRPADWGETPTIRLPEALRPRPDSARADSVAR